jgi:uncharacterized membrane protein
MIIGAEVAMIVLGLYILFKGKTVPGKNAKYVVQGWPARFMGIIMLMPIPISFSICFVLGVLWTVQGKNVQDPSFRWAATAIELSVLVICFVAIAIISRFYRIPVEVAQQAAEPEPWSEE